MRGIMIFTGVAAAACVGAELRADPQESRRVTCVGPGAHVQLAANLDNSWTSSAHDNAKGPQPLICQTVTGLLSRGTERGGFEPPVRDAYTRFPSVLLRPLGHLSQFVLT